MRIKVYDEHFDKGWKNIDIPFKKWLKLVFFGKTYLRHGAKEGWLGALPFYIVKCTHHGYFLDYPQGWSGYFTCPLCLVEESIDCHTGLSARRN